ncbi:NOP19-like protein [Lachancea thermotolerans]|uniref:KLTH0H00616p n=1 Tax=Lachancea thermotolerans (strain ATCC 56472 / CBS 6340 / NRRL Y-8284) TaxID=559295 RepID=C5E1Y3_LACTC|nr:KLTH0H00616p [Lachancea thermotolerans CBS 6340]CAR30044.1 KLTH0H00616p [Lachancea thermotolerans CBS 6340]
MSRAKEIQEKLSLQAKLQASFNASALKASEWLPKDSLEDQKSDLTSSKDSFYSLPVIGVGAGLSFEEKEESNAQGEVSTIGEFINSNKKLSSLAKKKKGKHATNSQSQSGGIFKVSSSDTRAMVALKRKMKSGRRQELRNKISRPSALDMSHPGLGTKEDLRHSDSDEEPQVTKTSKKSYGLLFESKKPKRK